MISPEASGPETNRILHIASRAGQIVLESGGETYRVQETISRIGLALGMKEAESFVVPTGIQVSFTGPQGDTLSLVRRIARRTIDLNRVRLVNNMARRIERGGMPLEEIEAELSRIAGSRGYGPFLQVLCGAIVAAFFARLFGGGWADFSAAFVAGAAVRASCFFLGSRLNDFSLSAIGGALAALFALAAVHLGLASSPDRIIIGVIMLLVPGIAVVNAVRDALAGDLVAGASRAVEAFVIAVGIAVGVAMVLKFLNGAAG